jgi:hypothetical protein
VQKAYENWQDRPRPTFKSGGRCADRFSKENCLMGKIFGLDFKTAELALAGLQKLLVQLREICLSNRSKGFELVGFEKLFANSIVFHVKGLRIY